MFFLVNDIYAIKQWIYLLGIFCDKTENITERVPLIFPDTAEIMEYLPDEIYLSAEYSRIDELHWYNVQTNSEYRNIIQEALLKLMISQEYEYVNRLAENVKRKLENKREESKTWYRIWLEIEAVNEKKNYGYEALDSYKINGRIAAFCAEALYSGICQKDLMDLPVESAENEESPTEIAA